MKEITFLFHLMGDLQLMVVHQMLVDHHQQRFVSLERLQDGAGARMADHQIGPANVVLDRVLVLIMFDLDRRQRRQRRRHRTEARLHNHSVNIKALAESSKRTRIVAEERRYQQIEPRGAYSDKRTFAHDDVYVCIHSLSTKRCISRDLALLFAEKRECAHR